MEKKTRTTYKEPKFFLDNKNATTTGIFLKYSFAPGKRISFFTGQRIEPSKWSYDLQRVKRNVTGASDLNDILNHLSETAVKEVRQASLKGYELTVEELKSKLNAAIGKQTKGSDFFDIFDTFVRTESNLSTWTSSTLAMLATVKRHLQKLESYRKKEISFARFDVEELIMYLQERAGLRNSTIQKHVKILSWFFNWCLKKGNISEPIKLEVNLKHAVHKVIFLSLEEIRQINAITPPNEYLERTKDIFTFQCFTGLRFSDLHNLKASDINSYTIHVTTIKTGQIVDISLNETTRSILNKYKEHQDATGNALPVPVNQVYNRFLKELAKLAGLNEKITLVHYRGATRIEETFEKWQLVCSHTARRSFVTNGLTLGISAEVLRSWTGHQNDKSFKQYLEIVKQRKQTDMEKFTL